MRAAAASRAWPALARARRRPLSLLSNSLTLIAAKVAAMALGFVFWVLAARLFAPAEVGLAAGVVSAMMLCTQLATLGFGSAVIAHYPEHRQHPSALLNSAFLLVAGAAAVCAALFVLFAAGVFGELDVVGSAPGYAALFAGAAVFGTLWIILDQVSTTLRRGDQALVRGVLFGGSCVTVLVAVAVLTDAAGWEYIFLPWVVSGAAVCAAGLLQLRRSLPGWRMRPEIDAPLAGRLVRLGLPNWALTMAERTPGLMLPVIVTELLSPQANAAWYAAWMMAWVVYIVPIQVGLTLFAELVDDPSALGRSIRRGVRISLSLGLSAALVVALGADLALSILGASYAEEGATPLRILVLAVIPLTLVQAYFAACRASRRLGGAIVAGWLWAGLSVGLAALAGVRWGLTGMAIAWVASQYGMGAWAALGLRRVRADFRASRAEVAHVPVPEAAPGPALT